MTLFTYLAKDTDGETVSGSLDARDETSAKSALKELGLVAESIERRKPDPSDTPPARDIDYYPLGDTLRIYAGWLTAVLFLVYAMGSYQQLRNLPYRIDLLDDWIESSVLLRVTFVSFLFLALGSLHRALGGGIWKGIVLAIAGFIAFTLFMANT